MNPLSPRLGIALLALSCSIYAGAAERAIDSIQEAIHILAPPATTSPAPVDKAE